MHGSIDYASWLAEISKTNKHYEALFVDGKSFPPIFFFGNPIDAVAATIGLNPSAQEFSTKRQWNNITNVTGIINRCVHYFESPSGVPPHTWFEPWETFLRKLGLSYYKVPRTIHLDISPRATRSMGTFQNTEQIDLFLNLAKNDLKYMINQLLAYPNIRYLYAAGSITKKYYLIEFLRRFGGFSLNPVVPFERGGTGKIGLYTIDLGDGINRHLFFCSTSPSSRSNKDTLSQKASLLKTNYSEFLPSSW